MNQCVWQNVLRPNRKRGPYTPFSVRFPAETTMHTSLLPGSPKILLTLTLSMPSMGHVS